MGYVSVHFIMFHSCWSDTCSTQGVGDLWSWHAISLKVPFKLIIDRQSNKSCVKIWKPEQCSFLDPGKTFIYWRVKIKSKFLILQWQPTNLRFYEADILGHVVKRGRKMWMCILIRTALSLLEDFAFAHINLGSCQSSPDQLTNVLTSGGKLSQNIKQTTFAFCSSL